VCVDSLLSVSSREEQANASPKNIFDHDAKSLSHGFEALNTDLTETSFDVSKSPLSVDAKVFHPSPKLNVYAPVYDPFGNTVECGSPQSNSNLDAWREILKKDGILEDKTESAHKVKGLTVDTSLGWTSEAQSHPTKYTPTTPCPYFHLPHNLRFDHESPTYSGYNSTSPEAYNYLDGKSWPFEDVQSPDSTLYDYPSPTPLYNYPSPTSDTATFFHSSSSVKNTPTGPRVCQPVGANPTTPGLRDPVDLRSLDLKEIVCQHVRGWNSSRKLESIIELMNRENISAMCIQETWESGNYIKEIRGYLISHHNKSIEQWRADTTKQQGGIEKVLRLSYLPNSLKPTTKRTAPNQCSLTTTLPSWADS
jgi:hypothetical protein